jgi:hypothetical protein
LRVVHLARKPLSESSVAANILKHGTGAVNVDATRIGTSGGSTQPSGMDRLNAANAAQGYRPGTYQKGPPVTPAPGGRWPANVILQHLPGCQCQGTKKVQGSPTSRVFHSAYAGTGATKFLRGHSHPGNQHADSEGKETVADWVCVPNCPVADLDTQQPNAGAFAPVQGSEPSAAVADEGVYGNRRRVRGAFHRDTGGASRFFKQVQAQSDG